MKNFSFPSFVVPALLILFLIPLSARASVTLATPNTSALSQGLVGYWPLDGATTNWTTGTVSDVSGSGNNGSLVNASTSTSPVPGKIGQALRFPGVSTGLYVTVPTISIPTAVTASAWVYSSNFNQFGFVVSKNPVNTQWEIFFEGGFLRWRGGAADNTVFCVIPSSGKWHHIVGTQTGTFGALYIDGVLCDTGTLTAIGNGSGTVHIGRFNTSTYYPFNGLIDDVHLYNRALSAQEVALLYATGASRIGSVSLPSTSSFNFGLNAGLVGYWPLDGSTINWTTSQASDVSAQGNIMSLKFLSKTTAPVAGKIGQALKFDGTSTYLVASTTTGLPTTIGTISAWIKTTNAGTGFRGIVQRSSAYGLYLYGNVFGTYDNGAAAARLTAVSLNDNKWHHVAMSFQSGVTNGTLLYIDGVLSLTTTITATAQNAVDIGMGQGGAPQIFSGAIDDVHMYNRVLSAAEIAQLYSSGAVNVGHSNTSSGTGINSGLVGYWTFDGGSMNWRTNTVADQSGSGNTGTLISLATSTAAVPGKLGQAVQFNGTSSYVKIPNSSSLNPSNLTISVWARSNTSTWNNYGFLVSKRSAYVMHPNQALTTVSFYIWTTTWVNVTCTATNITKWNLYTMTWNGTNLTAYINGSQCSTGTPGGSLTTADTGEVDLGHDTGSRWFNGSEDDVRIYNRALSAQEVKQLYLMGK